MKTELLDRIIAIAEQKQKENDLEQLTAGCVYLAMLETVESNELKENSEQSEELASLSEKIREIEFPNRRLAEKQLQKSNGERAIQWSRSFRLWMSMKKRSSVDALMYVAANWPDDTAEDAAEDAPAPVIREDRQETRTVESVGRTTTDEDAHHQKSAEKKEEQDVTFDQLVKNTTELREKLYQIIIGQNYAVRQFTDAYFQGELFARLSNERKGPRSMFLFTGSPGVGKTFLATEAAKHLGLPTKRLDMSSFADDISAFYLTGADANFHSSRPGELTGFVEKNPRSVVIFDEVEKAHPKVINLLLQILDAGFLFDSKYQRNVSFGDTIVIFTTNAGRQLYDDPTKRDFSGVPKQIILDALEKDINPQTSQPFFPAALCSRLATGCVVMFNRLSAGDLVRISAEKLLDQQESLKKAFDITSSNLESMAPTLLFSLGGQCDARSIVASSKRFFSEELLELVRLAHITAEEDKASLQEIRWIVDTDGAEESILSLYEPEQDAAVLFFGKEEDQMISSNPAFNGRIMYCSDLDAARQVLRDEEPVMAVIDYLCGVRDDKQQYLNAEDRFSDGRTLFGEIREGFPDLPVFIRETEAYHYNQEETVSLINRGARGILLLSDEEPEAAGVQLNDLCLQIHHQQGMDHLAMRHKVLSYETSQALTDHGRKGEIRLFDFHLRDAIEAEDRKTILSAEEKPDLHWDDIVVSNDVRSELQYFMEYLKNPKGYLKKGAKVPKGILLYGPPGTGKTSLAKVAATESGVTFLTVSADQFFSRWAGEGPRSVHRLFASARKYAPAILFIDEIDAVGRTRTESGTHDGQQEILNALLTEMDGFKSAPNKPVLVMAATNLGGSFGNTRGLDPALVRRFDRSINIDLPDKEGRIKLLHLLCAKNPLMDISETEISSIAERSVGMSPALIEGAVNFAVRDAIRNDCKVTDEVMDEAFEKYNSGEERQWEKSELLRTARHEAGHAFICHYFGETPSYLTIVARDDHGGYMMHESREKKGVYTKEELLHRICTAMGGRAAELVYYEEAGLTTGASSDLSQASEIAASMVCSYGLYENVAVGTIRLEEAPAAVSDQAHAQINRILAEQLELAKKLIAENKEAMDRLAEALMNRMHLNGPEILEVLGDSETDS